MENSKIHLNFPLLLQVPLEIFVILEIPFGECSTYIVDLVSISSEVFGMLVNFKEDPRVFQSFPVNKIGFLWFYFIQ